jgi:hypothetical protein
MSTLPAYTSQTTLHEVAPPPYSSTPSQQPRSQQQLQQTSGKEETFTQESQPDASANQITPQHDSHVNTHHRTTSSSSTGTSKKSRWQKLKQENEERKAKMQHVTHEQAAELMGHDEKWLKEREMGKDGENGWVKTGGGGCVVM